MSHICMCARFVPISGWECKFTCMIISCVCNVWNLNLSPTLLLSYCFHVLELASRWCPFLQMPAQWLYPPPLCSVPFWTSSENLCTLSFMCIFFSFQNCVSQLVWMACIHSVGHNAVLRPALSLCRCLSSCIRGAQCHCLDLGLQLSISPEIWLCQMAQMFEFVKPCCTLLAWS